MITYMQDSTARTASCAQYVQVVIKRYFLERDSLCGRQRKTILKSLMAIFPPKIYSSLFFGGNQEEG